ncbi:STAS domain-containing protein [Pasteurellaceae bacterium HPA106]|uniref:STAS domain-containing protein n=1 Tax=Spirabiliibacterium pneumoniae TaxID=221400 RepID=UPI001AADF969|nr:STAS domain-containing protein [Spirabiliibacterium pneumoniae]MBE2896679.1 STAS domain-containing protein [Spirabiliibacterium pneumoniae]
MDFHWHSATRENGAQLILQGALTRNTLQKLWQARGRLVEDLTQLDIELAYLSVLDSAGFALVCDIIHFYAQKGQVRLHHAPAILRDLAKLYDLDSWLETFIVE